MTYETDFTNKILRYGQGRWTDLVLFPQVFKGKRLSGLKRPQGFDRPWSSCSCLNYTSTVTPNYNDGHSRPTHSDSLFQTFRFHDNSKLDVQRKSRTLVYHWKAQRDHVFCNFILSNLLSFVRLKPSEIQAVCQPHCAFPPIFRHHPPYRVFIDSPATA